MTGGRRMPRPAGPPHRRVEDSRGRIPGTVAGLRPDAAGTGCSRCRAAPGPAHAARRLPSHRNRRRGASRDRAIRPRSPAPAPAAEPAAGRRPDGSPERSCGFAACAARAARPAGAAPGPGEGSRHAEDRLDRVGCPGCPAGDRVLVHGARLQAPAGTGSGLGDPRPGDGRGSDAENHQSDHLDLCAPDQAAEVARLLTIGARRVEWRYPEGADYVVLADPDGNRFCVVGKTG